MTQQNIENILKMRMAVFQSGIKAGIWKDITASGASEMMNYLFQKSGHLAFYNLVLEYMRKQHEMFTGSVYFLFRLPVQVEKELADYIKKEKLDVSNLVEDGESYLETMDTIVTDHGIDIINIGSFNPNEVDNLLRLCASHYRYSFQTGVAAYPYMT